MTATFNMEKNKAQQENKQRQPPDLDSAATADEWAGYSAAQKPSPMPSVQTNDLTWDQPPWFNDPGSSHPSNENIAILTDKLTDRISAKDWSGAVDTLKLILDLDPTKRPPPLYCVWSPKLWGTARNRSRRDEEDQ